MSKTHFKWTCVTFGIFVLISFANVSAQQPAPGSVTALKALDTASDSGGSVTLSWAAAADPGIKEYVLYRSKAIGGPFEQITVLPAGTTTYVDSGLENDTGYYYKISAVTDLGISESVLTEPVIAKANWFNRKELFTVIIGIWILFWIIYYIQVAASGKQLYIRKIAGIEAVEDAVGRATEMGRSVLFVPGIQDMDSVQTVAGITILASIARKTAEYETRLSVPVSRSIVMSTGRETVKEAYLSVGRPDLFQEEMVFYITDEQFGYVAAVDGLMVREKPATCFYMGGFFAESLILAETGNYIGAIQIAGTAMPTQLPFFVAACDYTLIGEELFAASAYLSKDRKIIGALRGQDMGKITAAFFIVFGTIFATLGSIYDSPIFEKIYRFLESMFSIS